MTKKEAVRILGIADNFTKETLKKRYRALMMVAHPDAGAENAYPFDARDINAAYEYLLLYQDKKVGTTKKKVQKWNAPENPNAYVERDIYHTVEHADGEPIGRAVIDSGKYQWIADEEFSLFLASLFACSKQIVDNLSERKRDETKLLLLQAELTYLLAQQFVDSKSVLQQLAKTVTENEQTIYQVDAMLSINERAKKLARIDYLMPARLVEHKLYVSDQAGNELGYLSFADDRLYYAIIPLFERKAVQVRMQRKKDEIKHFRGKPYFDICLEIRLLPEEKVYMIESINLEIEQLLQHYMES